MCSVDPYSISHRRPSSSQLVPCLLPWHSLTVLSSLDLQEHTARILQLIESAAGDIEAADRRAQQLPGGMAQVATELQAISWFLAQLKTKLEEGTIDKEEL